MVSSVHLNLPASVLSVVDENGRYRSIEHQMTLVLEVTEANVKAGGGPFGAAVFDHEGRVVAIGANRVVPDSAPIAHAEIVAIAAAGQRLGTWDLASVGRFNLVSSTEPCAMCLGAVPWSGVSTLAVGARDSDARSVGFDEGRKPADWVDHLTRSGISVHRDVARAEASALLRAYVDSGGRLYNGTTVGAMTGDGSDRSPDPSSASSGSGR